MKLVALIVGTPTLSSLSSPKTQSNYAKSKPAFFWWVVENGTKTLTASQPII
jgi:hypothetical protein